MTDHPAEDKNFRDFFRVNCNVELQIKQLSDADIQGGATATDFFPPSNAVNLMRELRHLEFENSHILHNINEFNRDIAAYFAILNKKLELLARRVTELSGGTSHKEQTVSLSEGGIAFQSAASYETGKPVACQITLLPSLFGVSVLGRITQCTEAQCTEGQCTKGTHNYDIAICFENLADTDRQILAKHVLQVQLAEKRRRHKEE